MEVEGLLVPVEVEGDPTLSAAKDKAVFLGGQLKAVLVADAKEVIDGDGIEMAIPGEIGHFDVDMPTGHFGVHVLGLFGAHN